MGPGDRARSRRSYREAETMDQREYLVPRFLDAPPMVLFIEADTAAIALGFLFLGFFIKQVIICTLIGVLIARFYARSKGDGGRGAVVRFLYWYLPSKVFVESRVESHQRFFLG